jgi:Mce-associated membrane protein
VITLHRRKKTSGDAPVAADAVEMVEREAANEASDDEVFDEPADAAADAGPAAKTAFRAQLAARMLISTLALGLTVGAAYQKWQVYSIQEAGPAGSAAVQAASDTAVALLSYRPETVQADLTRAQERLTGSFRDTYSKFTTTTVIPAAQTEKIATQANVQAGAVVSATVDHAVVLLAVNQTITIAAGAPTNSSWSVRAAVVKVGERWLVSAFDPV